MAQENITLHNYWNWNCGSKDDFDYHAIFGSYNQPTTLTIQRTNLAGIVLILKRYNEVDGWSEGRNELLLGYLTSEPYTWNNCALSEATSQSGDHSIYYNKLYEIKSRLEIWKGTIDGEEREIHDLNINGWHYNEDDFYEPLPGCPPLT